MSARTALVCLAALAVVVFTGVQRLAGATAGSPTGRVTSDAHGGLAVRAGQSFPARVVRVVDGDTVHVRAAGAEETVRYIGMDTPESVKPGVPVQCFAEAASRRNKQLVAGRTVAVVVGAEPRDRYGRLLGYVYRTADGSLVNAELVREGYARTLTIPPNDDYAPRFATLAREAQRAGRGLWSACPAR